MAKLDVETEKELEKWGSWMQDFNSECKRILGHNPFTLEKEMVRYDKGDTPKQAVFYLCRISGLSILR